MKPVHASLTLVAIAALASGVDAQTPPPSDSSATAPSAARNRGRDDQSVASPAESERQSGMDARMGGVSAGAVVKSPAGESIGAIKDVVPDEGTGRPAYVLIATRKGSKVAVPYAVVMPLVHNGHITLDRARLEGAPPVGDKQLLNRSDTSWRTEANRYWSGHD